LKSQEGVQEEGRTSCNGVSAGVEIGSANGGETGRGKGFSYVAQKKAKKDNRRGETVQGKVSR